MNPDGKKSVVITLLTTMLTLVFFAASIENRSTAQDSTHSPPASVSLGLWGGPDLEMQATPHGATLEFDCAQGTISEPLALDQSGTFHARGSFQTQGGAARKVQPSGGINVIYSGNLRGETLQSNSPSVKMPERTNSPRRSSRSSADKPEISRNATSDELTPLYYWPKVGRPRPAAELFGSETPIAPLHRAPKIFCLDTLRRGLPTALSRPIDRPQRNWRHSRRHRLPRPLHRRANPSRNPRLRAKPLRSLHPCRNLQLQPHLHLEDQPSRRQWSQRRRRPPLQR